jgi:transcription initiation factor TFIID subunit TAF12
MTDGLIETKFCVVERRIADLETYYQAKIRELERRIDLLQTEKTTTQRNLDELY